MIGHSCVQPSLLREDRESGGNRPYHVACLNLTLTGPPKTAGNQVYLAPVVQKQDSAIHRINHYPVNKVLRKTINCTVQWKETYLVDSTIHLLNNWDLDNDKSFFFCCTYFLYLPSVVMMLNIITDSSMEQTYPHAFCFNVPWCTKNHFLDKM